MIRVLIVDASASVRQICTQVLSRDPEIEIVDSSLERRPDVVMLAMESRRPDGLARLRKLMLIHSGPTIVLTPRTPEGSELAIEALNAGAAGVACIPGGADFTLVAAVRRATRRARAAEPPPPLLRVTRDIVAIGASAGGTVAIEAVLTRIPANAPGIVVVQHMPPVFTRSFAERLDRLCPMEVREAADGDSVRRGTCLIAPGGKHLLLHRAGTGYVVEVAGGALVSGHRPSVDVLFTSVARAAGSRAIGVVLTGMGRDGALGLGAMRTAGALTLAQDEDTCVVWGMPRAAVEVDAAMEVHALPRIPGRLIEVFEGRGGR